MADVLLKPSGSKYIIKDDLLAPDPFFNFTFTGKGPSKFIGDLSDMLLDHWNIQGNDVFNKEIKWHTSETGVSFYLTSHAAAGLDAYSKLVFEIRVVGKEDKTTKEGTISIVIHPYLMTTPEIKSSVQSLWWFLYNFIFYDKKRVSYLAFHRKRMADFKQVLLDKYGTGVKIE